MTLRLIAVALLAFLFLIWAELPEEACRTDTECGCDVDCLD